MKYILIAYIAGSLIVSEHDNKEACLGREAILKEQKVSQIKCVEAPSFTIVTTSSGFLYSCTNPNCK